MAEYINPDYVPEPEKMNVKKGLEGAVIDTTSVSKVNADTNSLVYRGYPVQDLAENCRFEEVAYLLYNGELPTASQLSDFEKKERGYRDISTTLLNVIKSRCMIYETDSRRCLGFADKSQPRRELPIGIAL